MKRVLLIIPAYNEEGSIVRVARNLNEFFASDVGKNSNYSVDYIVINDGSKDRTANLCRGNGIPMISLSRNLGIGGAVQTGYKYAVLEGYDAAVQFDGDGQHDIRSLDGLVQPILRGEADFTVGSRFLGREDNFRSTAMRRFGIRFLSNAVHRACGLCVTDCTSGYRAAGKQAAAFLSSDYPVDYPEPESLVHLYKKGYRITEVPAHMFERTSGESSIRLWKSAYYMIKVTLAILIASVQRRVH